MGSIGYRPDIQGLRAIAVLAVVIFHFNSSWLPGGFVGVDIFLVISGFLIVRILLKQKDQGGYQFFNSLRYFYTSRFKRIAPAYFTMLVIVSLGAAILFLSQDFDVYRKSLKKAAYFNSNNYFSGFGDYFAPANYEQVLLHTWSLAVEIQFYLLAPFIVLLLPTKSLKFLFSIFLIGLTAFAEYRLRFLGIEQETYYSLYARLPEFFAGGLVAIYVHSAEVKSNSWFGSFGLGLIIIAIIMQPNLGHFPGLPALLPVAGAALMLMQPVGGVSFQLLASPPMVWLGKISYSLYLWHWPVLAFLRYYSGNETLSLTFSLIFLVLTFSLAVLSFYWIETPFRIQRTRTKQVLVYAVLAVVVLGTSKIIEKINQAFSPPALSIEYQRYADASTICHGQVVGECLKGDLNSKKEILVLGDSHAAMLNYFFDGLGKKQGFKARVITASSCVTIPGFDYKRIDEWSREACLKQIDFVSPYIARADTIFIAAMWSWHLESKAFNEALAKFIQDTTPHAKVIVMSQEPLLKRSPLRGQRFEYLGVGRDLEYDEVYLRANQELQQLVHGSGNTALYLDLDGLELFRRAPIHKGQLIYYDAHHLNEVGAIEYARQAAPIIRKLLGND